MHPNVPGSNFPPLGESWLLAPSERSADFFPAYARISVALQRALRQHVPASYFDNFENFRDTKKAYPMLVYRASRPFRARMCTDLTYDVLNPETLARVFRSAKQCLPELLPEIESRLHAAADWDDIARHYQPKRSADIVDSGQRLSKSRRCLYVLIRCESMLMNALIDLAGLGKLRVKHRLKRTAAFEKRWSYELRRIYPGIDCLSLAPALLDAATQALTEYLNPPSGSENDPAMDDPGEPAR